MTLLGRASEILANCRTDKKRLITKALVKQRAEHYLYPSVRKLFPMNVKNENVWYFAFECQVYDVFLRKVADRKIVDEEFFWSI